MKRISLLTLSLAVLGASFGCSAENPDAAQTYGVAAGAGAVAGSGVAGTGMMATPGGFTGGIEPIGGASAGSLAPSAGAGAGGEGVAGMLSAGMGGMPAPAGSGGMDAITGGTGVAGMDATAGMGAGTGEPTHEDLGAGDGSDVIAIGDSWMNLGTAGIQQSLLEASGQPYRAYGVPGTRLLDGAIPAQYTTAKADNPDIKTVVMTGGGNDVLQDPRGLVDCPAVGMLCKDILDMVGERFAQLADEMAADGVEDVIFIMYTRGTLLGAGPIDYAYETITPLCDNAPLRCHIVDSDEVRGMTMELRDGIHPTDANYDLLGEHIYDLMVSEGMRR